MKHAVLALLLALVAGCGTDDPQPDAAVPPPPPVATPSAQTDCPAEYEDEGTEPWVPEPPTTETPGRLVPDADPVEALVCRYADGSLDGEVLLADGLNRIRHDLLVPEKLAGQNRACTLIGGTPVPHLMRLSYADGDLWLSATEEPNSCTDTGNGAFVSSAYLGGQLAESFDAGRWVPLPTDVAGCQPRGVGGRLGQERRLLPPGWESITLCRPTAAPPPEPRELDRATAEQVATLLGQVQAEPGGNTCAGSTRTVYELLVRYPEGPPVFLTYSPGCEPPMRNFSLEATPTSEQGAGLEDLLRAP